MSWRIFIRIVALLPSAKLVQHVRRCDSLALGTSNPEYFINWNDAHHRDAYWITDGRIFVDSWDLKEERIFIFVRTDFLSIFVGTKYFTFLFILNQICFNMAALKFQADGVIVDFLLSSKPKKRKKYYHNWNK